MRMFLGGLACIGVLCLSGPTWAATGVAVESKTATSGDTNVSVGIYIENDVPVVGIVIPLEIRSVDPGAFIARRLELTVHNRLLPWEKGSCFKVVRYVGTPARKSAGTRCYTEDREPGAGVPDTAGDFVSPDAVMYTGVGVEPQAIAAGTDGTPRDGEPSLVLTFDVTRTPGRFEIDTTCIPPANHLMFVADHHPFEQSVVPVSYFNKGVIRIEKK